MAGKTVLYLQEIGMFFMAVRTLVVPALFQSVAGMTVVAILLRVLAGKIFHVNTGLRMACNTARLDIFQFGKIGNYRCVRIVASLAVCQGEVFLLSRVMAHAALRYYCLALWRMPLVTVKAANNIPVRRLLALQDPDDIIVTLDTVIIRQSGTSCWRSHGKHK